MVRSSLMLAATVRRNCAFEPVGGFVHEQQSCAGGEGKTDIRLFELSGGEGTEVHFGSEVEMLQVFVQQFVGEIRIEGAVQFHKAR